jgi:SAM-dependent methyltransferase
MKNKIVVSAQDIEHLAIIRKNVREFIQNVAKEYDHENVTVLDIAPQDYLGAKEFFAKSKVFTLDINPSSGADYIADLCKDNTVLVEGALFDIVICTEVLEHTLNPFAAANEIFRVLKKGGLAAISTPFNFRIHGPLPDCWRFSEHGLRALFNQFSSVQIDSVETKDRDLFPIHYTTRAFK